MRRPALAECIAGDYIHGGPDPLPSDSIRVMNRRKFSVHNSDLRRAGRHAKQSSRHLERLSTEESGHEARLSKYPDIREAAAVLQAA